MYFIFIYKQEVVYLFFLFITNDRWNLIILQFISIYYFSGQLHCLPLTEPGNDDVKTATSLPAPKVFPKDANIYKIVPNNETILKFLQHSDDAKVRDQTSCFWDEILFTSSSCAKVYSL